MDLLKFIAIVLVLYLVWRSKSSYEQPIVGNLIYGAQCSRNDQCISGTCTGTCE